MNPTPSGNDWNSLIEQYNRELMRAYQRSSLPQQEAAAPAPAAPPAAETADEEAVVAFPAGQPDRAVAAPVTEPGSTAGADPDVAREVSPADAMLGSVDVPTRQQAYGIAEESTLQAARDAAVLENAAAQTARTTAQTPPVDDDGVVADSDGEAAPMNPPAAPASQAAQTPPADGDGVVADSDGEAAPMNPPAAPAGQAAQTPPADDDGIVADTDGEAAPMNPPAAPASQGNPMNPSGMPETDTGYLQVQVYTARGAVPIPGAHITISRDNGEGEELYTLTFSDSNGFSPLLPVATVSSELSQQPGTPAPFSTYDVRVDVPGYFTVRDLRIPVYGGVTSVQPVEMVPLPENYQGDTSLSFVEGGPTEL